jgi:3-oxoacyl-[acyl-carrier-protein] synthase II
MRRVVVTGVGPVSSIGIGKEEFWNNAVAGKGSFRNVDFDDVELEQYRSMVCSPVDGFNHADYLAEPGKLKRAGRATRFSVVGTWLALRDAGFELKQQEQSAAGPGATGTGNSRGGTSGTKDSRAGAQRAGAPRTREGYRLERVEPLRAGVILGQSMSNTDIILPNHIRFLQHRGPKRVNPSVLPESNANVGASTVAEWFGLKGTNLTVSTACSSATHAIGIAGQNIMNGIDDLIVTGGTEAPIGSYFFSGFDIIGALSRRNDEPGRASRPFDRGRDGFVLGEGAGILVLEELEHARARGARIYGELKGFGFSADAYNIVAPDPYGTAAINAIRKALSMGGFDPREVQYINAHGTSTVLNDPNETYIIKQVFGDHAYRVPISSSKSLFGHTIGAAGGLESIATLLAMTEGIIHPTINLENPDLEYTDKSAPDLDKRCDLDYVPGTSRKQEVNVALTQSFGFGGQNGALVFSKLD